MDCKFLGCIPCNKARVGFGECPPDLKKFIAAMKDFGVATERAETAFLKLAVAMKEAEILEELKLKRIKICENYRKLKNNSTTGS